MNDKETALKNINLQLKSFIGRKLIQIKFRENGNSFLLVFSDIDRDDTFSVIHFFNCFLLNEDGIHGLCITEVFLKKLGVFTFEYCTRHGIEAENFLEFNLITKIENNTESQKMKSLLIGCERIAITEDVSNSSHFWELTL